MSKVTIEHFGVEATGRNVTEAKRSAGVEIKRVIKNVQPRIYCHRGYSVVLSPVPNGWTYTLIHPDSDGRLHASSFLGPDDRDAEQSAIKHLFEVSREEGEREVPDWVPSHISRKDLVSSWKSSDAWQRAFRFFKQQDPKAGHHCWHAWACEHNQDFTDEAIAARDASLEVA